MRCLRRIAAVAWVASVTAAGAAPGPVRSDPEFTDPAIGMEFVCLEGGEFEAYAPPQREPPVPWRTRLSYLLGRAQPPDDSDQPEPRRVRVEDFCIGRYEVTVGQWHAVMGGSPPVAGADQRPVTDVSWGRVHAFIERLNRLSGRRYRLPDEAEWEFAARGRGRRETWAGTSDAEAVYGFGWLDRNSGFVTHAVGQKRPNRVGLYDMTGNVEEWCADVVGDEAAPPAPRGPAGAQGDRRDYVVRGGSYQSSPEGAQIRLQKRTYYAAGGNELTGFRLVYSPAGATW